jgi:uncharacterized protein (DUF58 family)
VVRALFDLESKPVDSDYELAFRRAEGAKRALVVVLCDLLEEAAARPLVAAVPVLTRRHAVFVASPTDPALEALARAVHTLFPQCVRCGRSVEEFRDADVRVFANRVVHRGECPADRAAARTAAE